MVVIGHGYAVGNGLGLGHSILHRIADTCRFYHGDIVVAIAKGDQLLRADGQERNDTVRQEHRQRQRQRGEAESNARTVPLAGGLRLAAAVTRARQMAASNVAFASAFESILFVLTEEYTQWSW